MPNRIIRESLLESDRVNSLSAQAESFFFRLMLKADDFGRYHAHTSLIKAGLFPLKLETIREADISRWIAEAEKAGLIALYEVQGKKYLEIQRFNQRTRAKNSKYPPPDGHVTDMRPSCAHGDGDGDGDGDERRESDAHIPSLAEFVSSFITEGIPPEYLEDKWAWFEGNKAWISRQGELKNYRVLVRQWWAKDRGSWKATKPSTKTRDLLKEAQG